MIAAAKTFETVRSMCHGRRGSKLNAISRTAGAAADLAKSGAKMSTVASGSDKREPSRQTFMSLQQAEELFCRNRPLVEAALLSRFGWPARAAGPDIYASIRAGDNLGGDRWRQTKMSA